MKVRINDDGITCREVNPFAEPNTMNYCGVYKSLEWSNDYLKWEKTEKDLRTFEIDSSHIQIIRGSEHRYEKCSIRDAELLPNGKIKIIHP